jgi:hypothetical protein
MVKYFLPVIHFSCISMRMEPISRIMLVSPGKIPLSTFRRCEGRFWNYPLRAPQLSIEAGDASQHQLLQNILFQCKLYVSHWFPFQFLVCPNSILPKVSLWLFCCVEFTPSIWTQSSPDLFP